MPIDYFPYNGKAASNIAAARPSVEDVGRDDLENDSPPPNPLHGLTAEEEIVRNWCLEGYARTLPSIIVSVRFNAGAPEVYKKTHVASDDIAITPTDDATGETSLTWPADSVPSALAEPKAYVNGATPGVATCEVIANGVKVYTFDMGGSAADLPFTVEYT